MMDEEREYPPRNDPRHPTYSGCQMFYPGECERREILGSPRQEWWEHNRETWDQ